MRTEIVETFDEEIIRLAGQLSREEMAYMIMKLFLNNENPSTGLIQQFHDWLVSPINAQAKEIAFERCFYEALEPCCPQANEVKLS